MSDTTKVRVIDIQTGKAVKNVNNLTESFVPLRKQIRDLTNQIAQLDQGTEEYNRALIKLADLQQKQREITEMSKFSNKDFGAVMSNLTTVSAGLVGGLNAISASMLLLSDDTEEFQKGLQKVQVVMAMIQGMSAIDTAVKSLKGLFNVFGGVGDDAAEAAAEVGTLKANIDSLPSSKKVDVSVVADESGLAKAKEDVESLHGKTVTVDVVADESGLSKIESDIDSLHDKKVEISVDADTKSLDEAKADISSLAGKTVNVSVDADTTGIAETEAALETLPTDKNVEIEVKTDTSGIEKTKAEIETLPDHKDVNVEVTSDTSGIAETEAAIESLPDHKDISVEVQSDITGIAETEAAIETLPDKKVISVEVEDSGIDDLTDSVSDLTKKETTLASTTATTTAATKGLDTTAAKATKGVKSLAQSIKNAARALKEFVLANPILAAIAAAIGAVAATISILNKRMEENGRIAREEADIMTQVNKTYDEQNIRLNVLLKTAKDENESLAERKAAVKELNKIVPEYNARINETTGALEASNKALDTYLANLKEKIKLEAYEGKIKEYYQKRAEVEEKINKLQNTGWFLVQRRVRKSREEIAELDKDIERMYAKIGQLDLSEALDTNKPATRAKAVVKMIADAIKELKKQAADFWDTFYGARSSGRQITDTSRKAFAEFRDGIMKTLKQSGIAEMYEDEMGRITYRVSKLFTKEFTELVKKSEEEVESSFLHGFKLEHIFKDSGVFDELAKQAGHYGTEIEKLTLKYRNLAKSRPDGKLTEAEQKRFEAEKKNYEDERARLESQLKGYREVIDYTLKYTGTLWEQRTAIEENQRAADRRREQLKIEQQYLKDIMANNPYAEIDKTIANMELEQEMQERGNELLKQRLKLLEDNAKDNPLFTEEINTLKEKILANEREIEDRTLQIDKSKYERRTQEVEKYFEEIDRMTEESNRKMANESTLKGLGTQSFDTAWKQQKAVVDAFKKKEEVLQSLREQGIINENEFNSRMLALHRQLNDESARLDDERVNKAVSSMNTYMNVFSSVTGSLSSILNEQMSKYDENSEQYKDLKIKEGWLTTMSGSLSAFMSGFQSGIPFPYNAILAAALGASTFAAGAAQVHNISSGSHTNALTSSAKSPSASESQYQVLTYVQNDEMNKSIRDQKVFVLEHDISKVQKRVSVREFQSSF